MKTFALALCVLVLAVTIQDISARPHGGRGPGAEGRRRGRPAFHGGICKVLNATTLDVLCDNSIRCPNNTECSSPPADGPQPPPIADLLIHSCIPKVCGPEAPCSDEATCLPLGPESRCILNDRPNHRHSRSSSEESSEEDFEADEENKVEGEEDEDTESCRDMVSDAIRAEVGSRGPGSRGRGSRGRGRHGVKVQTCLLRNTTSNDMLCNEFMSCPDFTQCVPTSADDARRPTVESLEIHECRPMNCTADGTICPTNTSCQQLGTTSWCLREGRRQGRRDHEKDESCNEILKDILKQSHGRRPFGRGPTADAGFGQGEGGNGRFGQGQSGNGHFGQGQSGNQGGNGRFGRRSNGGFSQGQNGPFGVGPLRQGQGLFRQGQMNNGGLGPEPEGNENLDVEEEESSSSEELPRGRPNRPSASAFGQTRGQRHGRRQP